MSSQAFHQIPGGRVQETITGERFEPRNFKSFDPVTQELYRNEFLQQSTYESERDKIEKPRRTVTGTRRRPLFFAWKGTERWTIPLCPCAR
jgi:hypothetical protein